MLRRLALPLAATGEDEMLKGIDHRLNAEVLACLRAMGHGDMLIVVGHQLPGGFGRPRNGDRKAAADGEPDRRTGDRRDPVRAAAGHVRG